jgi:hypothetical protein
MTQKKKKGNQKSKVTNITTSKVYILVDNIPIIAAEGFSSDNTVHVTKNALGLPENVKDPVLLEKFVNVTTKVSDTLIVVTADRGKKDKVMPKELSKHYFESGIVTITHSIKGTHNIATAYQKLPTIHKFKNVESYPLRYREIHLSKDGFNLLIAYKTIKGRIGTKTVFNLFPR